MVIIEFFYSTVHCLEVVASSPCLSQFAHTSKVLHPMRSFHIVTLLLVGNTYSIDAKAYVPNLSISVKDGSFGGLSGFDPSLSWSASSSFGGCDVEAGLDASVPDALMPDILSLPRSVWGKVSSRINGWKLSAGSDVVFDDTCKFDLTAVESEKDLSFQLLASTKKGLSDFKVKKGFDVLGGRLSFNPRVKVQTLSSTDVLVDYDIGSTSVNLQASKSDQKVTVSYDVNDSNSISPSVSTNGAMSFAWKRTLTESNSVTTVLKPSSINVKWVDGAWTAEFDSPLDGISMEALNVSIKRKLELL